MTYQVDTERVLRNLGIRLHRFCPKLFWPALIRIIEKVTCLNELNNFFLEHADDEEMRFIDEWFKHSSFCYHVSGMGKGSIPPKGRLVCVANHPLGMSDAMAIMRTIGEVRRDVRVIVNELIWEAKPLRRMLLPYNVFSKIPQLKSIANIHRALQNEEVVVFFPAIWVSRLTSQGIRDRTWSNGAILFAKEENAPILPVFVDGRNSLGFYLFSLIFRQFSTFRLLCESFKRHSRPVNLVFGEVLPSTFFDLPISEVSEETRQLKEHVYALGRGEKVIRGPLSRSQNSSQNRIL